MEEAKDKDQGKCCLRNAALDSCDSRPSLFPGLFVFRTRLLLHFSMTFVRDSAYVFLLLPLCLDSCTLLIVDLKIAMDARSAE